MEVAFETGTLATQGYSLEDALKAASNLGFQAVEVWVDRATMWPPTAGESDLEEARNLLSQYGLKAVATCPIPFKAEAWETFDFEYNIAHPDEGERVKATEFARKSMDVTHALGADLMLLLPGQVGEPKFMASPYSYRQYFQQAVKSLKELGNYAGEVGLQLGVENAVVGSFGDMPWELKTLMEEVGSEQVKVYLDVANANIFFPPLVYLRALRGLLAGCLHITDNDGTHAHHLPLGMGSINFKEILEELRVQGWDGYLVPEVFYPEDPLGGVKKSKQELERLIG